MKRYRYVAALTLIAFAALAQAPKGWKMRVDRSPSASDPDAPGDIKFVTMGSGFHTTNPAAAVYWNPSNTASGTYTLRGTFTLMKPSGHNNYYGLVFGGSALEGGRRTLDGSRHKQSRGRLIAPARRDRPPKAAPLPRDARAEIRRGWRGSRAETSPRHRASWWRAP